MTDPYDDQLKAARYRAERDQARQELARLRGEATTMSAYDLLPEEDREALRWVKKQGGLNDVKALHDNGELPLRDLCDILGLDRVNTSWMDAFRELEKRLVPEGCEWPRYESGESVGFGDGVSRNGKDFEVKAIVLYFDGSFALNFRAYSKGERVNRPDVPATDGDGCCEPGTYWCQEVAFTCDSCGHTVFVDKCMVDEIRYLRAKGIRTLNCCCGHGGKAEPFIIVNEGDERRMLDMGYERRVNEFGATYFTPKSPCPPKVLAADGEPLEAGQAVWEVATGEGYAVVEIYHGTTEPDFPLHCVKCERGGDVVSHMFEPSQLTHQRPVLDADGVPIKVGDTVWDTETGCGRTVRAVNDNETVEFYGYENRGWFGKFLTHTKPEPPDSWERIEEDLSKSYTKYWGCANVMCNHCPAEIDGKKPHERLDGGSHNCVSAMRRDIMRRCRALAERGE